MELQPYEKIDTIPTVIFIQRYFGRSDYMELHPYEKIDTIPTTIQNNILGRSNYMEL